MSDMRGSIGMTPIFNYWHKGSMRIKTLILDWDEGYMGMKIISMIEMRGIWGWRQYLWLRWGVYGDEGNISWLPWEGLWGWRQYFMTEMRRSMRMKAIFHDRHEKVYKDEGNISWLTWVSLWIKAIFYDWHKGVYGEKAIFHDWHEKVYENEGNVSWPTWEGL